MLKLLESIAEHLQIHHEPDQQRWRRRRGLTRWWPKSRRQSRMEMSGTWKII